MIRRRLITISVLYLTVLIYAALWPVVATGAFLIDVVRGQRSSVLRVVAYLGAYLFAEAVGVAALFAIWLGGGFGASRRRRIVDWTYRVQAAWTKFLLTTARVFFRLTFVIEGDDVAAIAPYVLLVRHTSILDTLLPSVFITAAHSVRLRFVLKRELLLDPCLDIAGNRLPNYFVARDGKESERDLDGVRQLATTLAANESLLIYPEGTRMTAAKRTRALARLAAQSPSLHARALTLVNTLPPRVGGVFALLDAAPALDVVIFAHTGLEGFARPADLMNAALVGTTVRMKLWRVPRAAIPVERDARLAWLYDEWQKLDDWVGASATQ